MTTPNVWKVVLAVLGVVLGGAGCAHKPTTARREGPSAGAFYPLAVGNRWLYDGQFLGAPQAASVEILKFENGYYLDSQGGQLTVDAYGLRDQKRYLLREPIEAGRTWTNVVSVSSVEHYAVLDVGFPCESPAGRFEGCVRVEGRNRVDAKTTLVNEVTFAPKVGIVRLLVVAETSGRRIPQTELRLKEYKVALAR